MQVWFSQEQGSDINGYLDRMDRQCPWKYVGSTFFFVVNDRQEEEEHIILLEANWEDCTLKVYNSLKSREQSIVGDIRVSFLPLKFFPSSEPQSIY